jgi:hypothetical protein
MMIVAAGVLDYSLKMHMPLYVKSVKLSLEIPIVKEDPAHQQNQHKIQCLALLLPLSSP